ncbi:YidC/Oxa1 family membrane protein insertase [Anaerocolumna aminovalerica]|uniref:YidC/Oxa1 family membrane protein insertase n=1 Tax=Anaerocolumna aminovalerica TaxID=1527 RepID=UPI000BE2BF4F|nr:YidC/Oxa1 family membrane protein insertase [Anaerocolumna aminovalerica]
MYSVFLTQSGGMLAPISYILGLIMNALYEFLSFFGIANVGLVIILFTFITRGLMIPLTIKQQKYTKLSSKMNPEITKINAKYKGKRDPESMQKMQLETQAVYEKYGASPTAGCLPLLIQLPIMFALYAVIRNIPAYVNDIYKLYEGIANGIVDIPGHVEVLTKAATEVGVSTTKFTEIASGPMSINHIIDIISKFTSEQWGELAEHFPTIQNLIAGKSGEIMHINSFIGGLNILDKPGFSFPGILIPVLAAGLQFLQTKLMTANTPTDKDNPMASSMSTMNTVMPLMSGIFCVMLPMGIGLYWVAGSAFAILQQIVINKHMDKIDVDTLIEKNKMKAKKKRARKGINPNASIEELAKKQTKSIDTAPQVNKSTSGYANSVKKNYDSSKSNSDTSYKSGGIADYANLLKNRNNNKGDK